MANNNLEMPKMETPVRVFVGLIALAVLVGGILSWFLGFWGVILMFVVLGTTTRMYTETVPGFYARILINHLSTRQRTVFQGMSWKLPWETQTQDVDLRVELREIMEETYTAKDALMKVRYVYTLRPDFSDKVTEVTDPGEKIIRYATYEASAIKQAGRALFSMLLSDYFAKRLGEKLLNKGKVNKAVFGTEDEKPQQLLDFESKHAVNVAVRLEDCDFDESTQKFRDLISQATSLDQAIQKLIEGGMDRVEAEKVAKLMGLENVKEFNVNVHAPHLQNLRDFTILGDVGLGDKKGGKK